MIKIVKLTGATEKEEKIIYDGLAALNAIWDADKFKEAVLAHKKLDGTIGFENTDDTNQEVWDKLHAADIEIIDEVYTPSWWERKHDNIVVGYEDEDGSVHQNSTFLDDYENCDVADNLAHESCHVLGWSHDYEDTDIRPYSVPYGIGQIVSALISPPKSETADEEDTEEAT